MRHITDIDIVTCPPSRCLRKHSVIWVALLVVGATFGYSAVLMVAAALEVPSRGFTIPYRLTFLAFCILLLFRSRRTIIGNLRQSWLMIAFSTFWVLYGLRLLLDIYIEPVELRLSPLDYLYLSLGGSLIPALAFGATPPSRELPRVFLILAVFGGITTLVSTWMFRDFIGVNIGRIGTEKTDIALGALSIGYMASSLAVLGFFMIIQRRSRQSVLGGAALVSIAFVPLAISASRGPVTAITSCLLIHLIARIRTGKPAWSLLLALGLAGSSSLLYELLVLTGSNLVSRFDQLTQDGMSVSDLRIRLWIDAWSQFLASPLLGSGLEEKLTLYYPHNILIESYMATGVVGGTAFLLFLIGALHLSFKILFNKALCDMAGWIPLLFIHYSIYGMLSGAIYTNVGFWAFGIAQIAILRHSNSALHLTIHAWHASQLDCRVSSDFPPSPFPATLPHFEFQTPSSTLKTTKEESPSKPPPPSPAFPNPNNRKANTPAK